MSDGLSTETAYPVGFTYNQPRMVEKSENIL